MCMATILLFVYFCKNSGLQVCSKYKKSVGSLLGARFETILLFTCVTEGFLNTAWSGRSMNLVHGLLADLNPKKNTNFQVRLSGFLGIIHRTPSCTLRG
jgi:hypothetical protein